MTPVTSFRFTGGDLEGLTQAAIDQNFSVTPMDGGDGVVLSTTDIVDELRWADFDDLMHGWAADFGSDYQGWSKDA